MGTLIGIVLGSLLGYGFVYWVVWVVLGWFTTIDVQTQNLGSIAIAAAILCVGVIYAIVEDSKPK